MGYENPFAGASHRSSSINPSRTLFTLKTPSFARTNSPSYTADADGESILHHPISSGSCPTAASNLNDLLRIPFLESCFARLDSLSHLDSCRGLTPRFGALF